MQAADQEKNTDIIDLMFKAGAQYGYKKSRRHPSVKPFIFGVKNRAEIFDLEKTDAALTAAKDFARRLASERGKMLFVGNKHEARESVRKAAEELGMPYTANRWVGGTLTNFAVIRSRVERLLGLRKDREAGELGKYTKKERLLIDREIERLEHLFGGIADMQKLPAALFVIDPKEEKTAAAEALKMNIPIIALAGSDSDISKVDYPITANDSARRSIEFFVEEIKKAYEEGKASAAA